MNIEIENAIKAIKANYPDSRYTKLRKGLDLAIAALEKQMPKPRYNCNTQCRTCFLQY